MTVMMMTWILYGSNSKVFMLSSLRAELCRKSGIRNKHEYVHLLLDIHSAVQGKLVPENDKLQQLHF